jgi:hypothetical protein
MVSDGARIPGLRAGPATASELREVRAMQSKSPVSRRETSVKSAMDHVLDAEQAVRDAIRQGERRGAAIIAEANEQVRRIEQRTADRIRRAHDICADAVTRATRLAEQNHGAPGEAGLNASEREALGRAADRLAADLCGDSDEHRRGL